jgi:anaerobic magnesium-protoporphyrin IX monomethyl ester cyclase
MLSNMTKNKKDAVFVGYENQDNLGLRYIMAYVEKHGYQTVLVPFTPDQHEVIAEKILEHDPVLVGFSIIFQYNIHEFNQLMEYLRKKGIQAHFTAGGHYPSLRPERTLSELPKLDSIVLFEGELTSLELIKKIKDPESWPTILGLAFRRMNKVVVNRSRPLVEDLDSLPWPIRGEIHQTVRGYGVAPLIASRGCHYRCSFCSIHQFYAGAPGSARRVRSPKDVVAEMAYLFEHQGVRLFLFQDDDFAAKTKDQRNWIKGFLKHLNTAQLDNKICWKISCRVDDVEIEILRDCRDHGLIAVYLGIESGNSHGLKCLNKHATVMQNHRAIEILHSVGLDIDFGFMLFDPDSTFESVRQNIQFLKHIASFAGPPIAFVKMLPLAGTEIEKRLAEAGRLVGDDIRPDYDLLDARLDYYALFVTLTFSQRNSDPYGVVERLRLAYFDCLVAQTLDPVNWQEEYNIKLRELIDSANYSALNALEESLNLVESCDDHKCVAIAWPLLNQIAAREQKNQLDIHTRLDDTLKQFSPRLYQAYKIAST